MEFDRVVYRVELPDDHRVSREHALSVLEETASKAPLRAGARGLETPIASSETPESHA